MTLYRRGDRVRISSRREVRHHRVPGYAKGQVGVVQRVCAEYSQPEFLAYGSAEPVTRLYRVRLSLTDLWPDYQGPQRDTLELEVFENWLETVETEAKT